MMDLYDGYAGLDVYYNYDPGEPDDWTTPGSRETVEIIEVWKNGQLIDLSIDQLSALMADIICWIHCPAEN